MKKILFMVLFFIPFIFVNASEITAYSDSLVRYTHSGTGGTTSLNLDSSVSFDPGESISYIAPRIFFDSPLKTGNTYIVKFTLGWTPSLYTGYLDDRTTAQQFYKTYGDPTFYGSEQSSATSGVLENPFSISKCSYNQLSNYIFRFEVICTIKPNKDLKYINMRWYLIDENDSNYITASTVSMLRYENLSITYEPSTTDSLLNEQIIIQENII